ncbi:cAMP-binding domain of CRP or a regulatory subunit of cAMP-dependent protein kinases [Catalinimonas alkaloidigena]|uniref:cAMP-binding domain of CRP or a regulatory subunit of cAMP-dependent protein kinases n=1 Tax=Catalinimonas alkaloidigena TaxID=1075417 RepID=A0A1G9KFK4_9BACT|nr:Crp/Fnr family transcriptional regulator [Catalinimonas alkaloidigena]SDL48461.1 cAMP-binding domain of CRP or a regulatory subunit of cAMP-dependent protein kinases [Catalinimonas alkaloidigena]
MKHELIEFLASFPVLQGEDLEAIAELIPVKRFRKGTLLLQEGEVPTQCFFVLKGCVRQYCILDGTEKTTAFFTEQNGTISSSHYVNQKPSDQYLVCVEDSLLICGDAEHDAQNYEKFPVLQALTSQMLEKELNETKDHFSRFITSSPEQRYLDLQKNRPDLLHRVPQHQIASYLGITPESLSRIRKRLVAKKVAL